MRYAAGASPAEPSLIQGLRLLARAELDSAGLAVMGDHWLYPRPSIGRGSSLVRHRALRGEMFLFYQKASWSSSSHRICQIEPRIEPIHVPLEVFGITRHPYD